MHGSAALIEIGETSTYANSTYQELFVLLRSAFNRDQENPSRYPEVRLTRVRLMWTPLYRGLYQTCPKIRAVLYCIYGSGLNETVQFITNSSLVTMSLISQHN